MVSLIDSVKTLQKNRVLIKKLVVREIHGRYKGSFLGVFWSFVNPLFMLALYTMVFKYIFKAKWPEVDSTSVDYSVMLFSGLVIHGFAAEVLSRSTTLITSNANFVKKVVFPLEVLSWSTVISGIFHTFIGLLVLLVFAIISGIGLDWTLLLLPLVLMPYLLFLLGISWVLASLSVYIRDLEQLMGTVITLLLFTSTTFFSMEHAPAQLKPVLALNPLTPAIEGVRDVVIYHKVPNWSEYGLYLAIATAVMLFGFYWFEKTRKGFADVL